MAELPFEKNLVDTFYKSQKVTPTIDGYSIFIEGLNAKHSHFANNLEDWNKLWPVILFIESLSEDFDKYEDSELDALMEIYKKYQLSQWTKTDFENFIKVYNKTILNYKLDYAGPVSNLLDGDNEFGISLRNRFDGNPYIDKDNFVKWLALLYLGGL